MKIGIKRYIFLFVPVMMSVVPLVSSASQSQRQFSDEEIIQVIGQRPLNYFRELYNQYENEFWDSYNALVDDPSMRMECRSERRSLQTRVTTKVCQPVFVSLIEADERQRALESVGARTRIGNIFDSVVDYRALIARNEQQQKEMARLMADLMETHPDLGEKYQKYMNSKFLYQRKKSLQR
jgi:hypothetical protein